MHFYDGFGTCINHRKNGGYINISLLMGAIFYNIIEKHYGLSTQNNNDKTGRI